MIISRAYAAPPLPCRRWAPVVSARGSTGLANRFVLNAAMSAITLPAQCSTRSSRRRCPAPVRAQQVPPPAESSPPEPSPLRWAAAAALLVASFACAMPARAQQRPQLPPNQLPAAMMTVSAPQMVESGGARTATLAPKALATIAATTTAFSSLTVAIQELMLDRLAYALTRLSTAHVFVKIAFLFAAGTPLVFVFGYCYKHAAGIPFKEALYKTYALLYRVPGIGLAKENNPAAYIVSNFVFFVGLFTFAILLGIVSDEVKTLIKNSRSGSFPVRQDNHLLVLNWNAQTVPLLRQIAQAKAAGAAFQFQPVVVLADKGKAEMDALISEGLKGYDLEVYTRKGSPVKMTDLRKVAAHKAKTVMLLHPAGDDAEVLKAASAMCLTAVGSDRSQGVVVQMQSQLAEAEDVLQSLSNTSAEAGRNFQLLQFPDKTVLSQFMTQTAAQPGIVSVWLSILQQHEASSQFTCLPVPEILAGKTFGEIRRHYPGSVVCGLIEADSERVRLNVADSLEVGQGAHLVALTRRSRLRHSQAALPDYEAAAAKAAERLKGGVSYQSKPKKVIVIGYDYKSATDLLPGFAEFAPSGSSVTFIVPEVPEVGITTRQGSVRFSWLASSNASSVKALTDAGIKTADSIVIGDRESVNDVDADARVLASILQIQDATFRSKRKGAPHVIARIRKSHTSKLASQYLNNLRTELAGTPERAGTVINNPEFVIPNDIVSALLTQVAAEPGYSKIIRELLYSSTGQEIYLRNPMALNLPMEQPLAFADIEETARRVKWTALGLIRADGRVQLALPAAEPVILHDGDKVVVLAEDY